MKQTTINNVSVDGFNVEDEHGCFDWTAPDDEVFTSPGISED